VLVNCAGIGRFAHSHEQPPEEWERIIGVNLTGTFLMCRATIPYLLDGGGNIVNIASNAGLMGQPYSAAYCASKAGVVNLTKALAAEYLRRAVRVNCVAPGGIDTPLQSVFAQFPEGVDLKAFRKFISPLGNSTPEEIATTIAYVASDDARYMVGAIVSVDGGITI
jgi:NAD(P)-dependent dehydrogenase (short-subunit alcohol dehydrogenase family)